MALYTELPIYQHGCALLTLALQVQTQLPRAFKRTLGEKIHLLCVQMLEEDEFTQGVNAAAAMLDKMADDYSNAHAWTDPDTGVAELTGAKEEYYNTLRELAGNVRSIVHGGM